MNFQICLNTNLVLKISSLYDLYHGINVMANEDRSKVIRSNKVIDRKFQQILVIGKPLHFPIFSVFYYKIKSLSCRKALETTQCACP